MARNEQLPYPMDHTLVNRIEAFLFMEGGSLTLRRLEQLLGVPREELLAALRLLAERLAGTGLALITTDTEATLAVASEASDAIAAAYQGDLDRDIGDAGLEVVAIVLYRGPSTRAQIDYIRGVNTSSTIRTLMSRGLLERTGNPNDAREYLYRPTPELLAHLGVEGLAGLPEYESIKADLAAFEARQQAAEQHPHDHDDA